MWGDLACVIMWAKICLEVAWRKGSDAEDCGLVPFGVFGS